MVLSQKLSRRNIAQARGDRSRTVACVKRVAGALLPLREPAHAAVFSQVVKSVLSPGQQLMRVGLMSHIPDQLILREVQRQMERHRQLHHTQVGGEMPPCPADLFDQELPDLAGKLF